MRKQLSRDEAVNAYCKLLGLVQQTAETESSYPGPGWEPVKQRLDNALDEAEKVLRLHDIDVQQITCE